MSEFLNFVINFMSILFIVALVGTFVLWLWLRRLTKQLEEELARAQQEQTNIISLDIEVDNGQYYCYNSINKQFICQGATAQEIRDAFRARYPFQGAFLNDSDTNPAVQTLVEELKKLKNETSNSV